MRVIATEIIKKILHGKAYLLFHFHLTPTLTSRSSAAAGVQMLLRAASRQAGTRVHLCVLVHESIHPAQPAHAPRTAAGRPLKSGAASSDGAARKKVLKNPCVFGNLPSGRWPKSCLWWQKVKRLWKFYSWSGGGTAPPELLCQQAK